MARFLMLTMLLFIAGSSTAAFAQFSPTPAFLTASVVEDQIATGRYQDAIQLLDSSLHRERAFGPSTSSEFAGLYASLGRVLVEIGELNRADQILKDAESTSQGQFNSLWEPIILRDRAALSLARREYAEAAKIAGKAYTESIQGGGRHGVGSIRGVRASYCQSIQAEAELRLGNTARAAQIISAALRPIAKKERKEPFYAPRILYAACRVASHQGNYPQAKEYCSRGLALVEPYGIRSRDVSLGYLALGEAYLESGDLARSRESTLKSINQTEKLFGNKHQDMVDALLLIALVDLKQDKKEDALSHARDAVRIATALFGENSPGLIDLTRTLGEILRSTNN